MTGLGLVLMTMHPDAEAAPDEPVDSDYVHVIGGQWASVDTVVPDTDEKLVAALAERHVGGPDNAVWNSAVVRITVVAEA